MRPVRVLIAVAAIALLAGCAQPMPEAVAVERFECGTVAEAGSVPPGFEPAAVYVCDSLGGFEDETGRWSATTVRRLEGDLAPLVAAFGEPSDPRWPGPCPAIGYIIPEVWLVDADGTAIRLGYPVTGCNAPKTERIDAALAELTAVDEQHLDPQLQESAAALAAGCSTRGDVLRIATFPDGDSGIAPADIPNEYLTVPAPPLPDPAKVAGMRVCRYDTDLALPASGGGLGLPELGTFADADEFDRDAALVILAAADYDVTPHLACEPADRYALLHPLDASGRMLGLPVQVELGGCGRLSTGSGFTLASDEVLALARG